MKRILKSLVGGIAIPVLYLLLVFFVLAVIGIITHNPPGNSRLWWLLFLPLEWSGHIYNRLFPSEPVAVYGPRGEVILASMITNFVVYSLLTYMVLWWRDNRRRVSRVARSTTA